MVQGDCRLRFSELRDTRRAGKRHYSSARGRILEAMIAVVDADAEDDEDWHRAWVRWRKAMIETGWTPPPNQDSEAA